MNVNITVYYYSKYHIVKDLITELNNKQPTIIKEDIFSIDLELKVNSFDDIICLLAKYNSKIKIALSIYSASEVRLFISCRDNYFSLGDQVE